MDQHKFQKAGVQEPLEIVGVEDEAGNPISALTILSLLERVAGIIDNVQSSQQRMEERQLELENNIRSVQGDVLKLAKDHGDTSSTVEKLLQKTRKVSANVKDVRTRVEKQNVRVKKVESTQDELLTRNKFRVVIYQVGTFSALRTTRCSTTTHKHRATSGTHQEGSAHTSCTQNYPPRQVDTAEPLSPLVGLGGLGVVGASTQGGRFPRVGQPGSGINGKHTTGSGSPVGPTGGGGSTGVKLRQELRY